MARTGKHIRGFSLVEILLVIAIIAILAGILFPILFAAKRQSAMIRCVANLHQFGKAFNLYLSDWNSVYPSPGGKTGDYDCWSQSGNGGLVRYVKSQGGVGSVWCCPELRRWQGKYSARTYSMNAYLRGPWKGILLCDRENSQLQSFLDSTWCQSGCPENLIESTRNTVLLYEGVPVTPSWPDSWDYIYRCGNYTCQRGWWTEKNPYPHTIDSWLPWHLRKNNYLYCDGHVKCHAPAQYEPDPPIRVRMEWWVQKSVMIPKFNH